MRNVARGADAPTGVFAAYSARSAFRSAGRMLFEYSSLGIGDPAEMKLIVFTPLEEERTAKKLERLLKRRVR